MESKFIVPDVEIMKFKNSKKSEDWDQVCPNCPNALNTLKQLKVNPQMTFKLV